MPGVYTRRSSTRNQVEAGSRSVANGSRSQRRARVAEEEEEDEEEVAPKNKRRRQGEDSRGRGSNSHRRGARHPEVEEVEEEDEAVVVDDDDGDDIQIIDDDDDGEDPDAEEDGGLWGIQPIKKLKVSKTALTAAEAIGSEDVKRRANDLARLALFSEHRRVVLKREDITKKVLDKNSAKAFPIIFNRAQKVLRYTFGYEMVELRVKGIDNEQIRLAGQSRAANGANEEDDREASNSTKSRTYILRSVLPAKAIAAMATPMATLSTTINNVKESVDGQEFDSEGVMLDWKRSSLELGSIGLLFFVLSLILINGRSITDDQLKSYLRRMSLDPMEKLPNALQCESGKENQVTMDEFLSNLQKQSYLECNKTGAAPQGAMSMDAGSLIGKRVQAKGRKSARTEEGEPTGEVYEWRWGPRSEVEITEKAVADFVSEVYMDTEEHQEDQYNGDADGERDDPAVRRAKRQELLLKSIEHAAGSQLIS